MNANFLFPSHNSGPYIPMCSMDVQVHKQLKDVECQHPDTIGPWTQDGIKPVRSLVFKKKDSALNQTNTSQHYFLNDLQMHALTDHGLILFRQIKTQSLTFTSFICVWINTGLVSWIVLHKTELFLMQGPSTKLCPVQSRSVSVPVEQGQEHAADEEGNQDVAGKIVAHILIPLPGQNRESGMWVCTNTC